MGGARQPAAPAGSSECGRRVDMEEGLADELDEEEQLVRRQRKEKKELQGEGGSWLRIRLVPDFARVAGGRLPFASPAPESLNPLIPRGTPFSAPRPPAPRPSSAGV